MFKSLTFAAALVVSANAWHRSKMDNFQTEAYGADNQNYGHQGKGYYGKNGEWTVADNHNSYRQTGHQGQGHNQWVDNAWNQWGTNNHWDTQKSVDNKWGNNSGKVNVNINSVSGHYDHDYGQQQRGMGYEAHQNVSNGAGYSIGLAGHSFGYAPGTHSFGYENNKDYGYGGWANNLGAWNHGANYDNLGNQFNDRQRDITNDVEDSHDVKTGRKVGAGYADLEELDDDREEYYGNTRVGRTGMWRGTGMGYRSDGNGYGNNFGTGYGAGYGGYGYGSNAGRGVAVAGYRNDYNRNSHRGYGGYGGYGNNSYGSGYGNAGYGDSYGSYGGSKGYTTGYKGDSKAYGGQNYEDDKDGYRGRW